MPEEQKEKMYINPENLYDMQKAEIVTRMYDNLSLDQLEEIEAELIEKYRKYKI